MTADMQDLTRVLREYLAALGAVTPIPWNDAAPDGGENNASERTGR
jgi:hypothetical protein